MFRRLAALAGGTLITVGMRLEDAAHGSPVLDDSCLRCRDRVVLSPDELSAMLLRAAGGEEPLNRIARDAAWTGVGE